MSRGRNAGRLLQLDPHEESKLSALIYEPHSSLSLLQRIAQLGRGIYSRIDFWVTVLLIAAVLVPLLIRHDFPPSIPLTYFLDDSWQSDLVFKAIQHVWVGRDVVFTYGSLYQALSTLVPWQQGFSLGSVYRSNSLIQFCLGALLIYVTSVCLLRWQPPWRRAFYVLLIAIFWWPGNSKSVFSVCAFSVITILVQRLCDVLSGVTWRAAAASIIVILSFLFSADCGVYSLAALGITIIVALFCSTREPIERKALFKFGALAGAFIFLAALAVNFFMSGALFDFRFWHDVREVAATYRWAMASSMQDPARTWFVATTAVCVLIFLVAWLWRDPHSPYITRRPLFLQGALLFSVLSLQTGVIRSDWEHVTLGLFTIISLTAAILIGSTNESAGRARSYVPGYLALALTAIFTGPLPLLNSSTLLMADWKHLPKDASCPAGMYFVDQACFKQGDFLKLRSVSSSVQSGVAGSDSIAIFPYENIYGVLARRRIAGGVVQNYVVAGNYLTDRHLAGLAQDKPPLLIYSMDGVATLRLDGLSNFTRTPQIWFYLQQHYKEESEPAPGILLMRRDDLRAAKWSSHAMKLIGSQQIDTLQEGLPIDLGPLPRWPDHGQFLKLDLTVRYPLWWHLLKPCRLTVDVALADGTHKLAVALAEPNKETEVWIYPGEEAQLRNYFSGNSGDWRGAAPPIPISHIALWLDPIDWLSVKPTGIAIRDVQVVQILG